MDCPPFPHSLASGGASILNVFQEVHLLTGFFENSPPKTEKFINLGVLPPFSQEIVSPLTGDNRNEIVF
jgi:hypothetical protein